MVENIGRGVSHKTKAVELYLKNYSLSEIARKMGHAPSSVNRYLESFTVVTFLHNESYPLLTIRKITKLSERSADTEAKRVILSLVTEEETDTLAKDGQVKELKDKRMARFINEAKQQGEVLSLADLSAIMPLAINTLSKHTRKYQKETGKLLPTAGNVLDIGRGITHKRETAELYAKGYNAMEISRMIDHELKNVESYIEDMERVKIFASKDVQTISRLTILNTSLVSEYLEIIRTYYPECMHLNSEEVNSNGKGN